MSLQGNSTHVRQLVGSDLVPCPDCSDGEERTCYGVPGGLPAKPMGPCLTCRGTGALEVQRACACPGGPKVYRKLTRQEIASMRPLVSRAAWDAFCDRGGVQEIRLRTPLRGHGDVICDECGRPENTRPEFPEMSPAALAFRGGAL